MGSAGGGLGSAISSPSPAWRRCWPAMFSRTLASHMCAEENMSFPHMFSVSAKIMRGANVRANTWYMCVQRWRGVGSLEWLM